MKAGMQFSHRIVAVSEGYAWECQTQEGGWGLDAIVRENNWKLRGIVNGIDTQEWNPALDPHLQSDGYTNYDTTSLEQGKRTCKASCTVLRSPTCQHMSSCFTVYMHITRSTAQAVAVWPMWKALVAHARTPPLLPPP